MNLRSRESNPVILVHGFDHVVDQLLELGTLDPVDRHRLSRGSQRGESESCDLQNHDPRASVLTYKFLCKPHYPEPTRLLPCAAKIESANPRTTRAPCSDGSGAPQDRSRSRQKLARLFASLWVAQPASDVVIGRPSWPGSCQAARISGAAGWRVGRSPG